MGVLAPRITKGAPKDEEEKGKKRKEKERKKMERKGKKKEKDKSNNQHDEKSAIQAQAGAPRRGSREENFRGAKLMGGGEGFALGRQN